MAFSTPGSSRTSDRAPRLARALALACLIAPAWIASARGAAPGDDPFESLRDEQLVTGAAKRPQPLSETPSAVTVITAEEIRAHGFTTVGEALRWVRGLFVTYDRNYTYVGVRGLLRPGDYNNKVLLTLDGHALNGSVYGDALFGPELGLDMERVERIEIVRGPGSALYGSNAALAVVNVVTRSPSREPGVTVAGRAGGAGEKRAYASIASARPGRPAWSIAGSWLDVTGEDLYFSEYDQPLTHSGVARDADGEEGASFLGAVEGTGWRLAAKFNERMKRFPTGAFGTTFGDRRNRSYDGHDFVELEGTHLLAPSIELHARAYWDGARYHGYYVYGPDSASVLNFDGGNGDQIGTELRANWSPTSSDVVTSGVEGRRELSSHLINYDVDPYTSMLDRTIRRNLGAGYLQDEHRFGQAILTAGVRLDAYPDLDPVASPRVDLVVRPGARTQWKLLAGSAFRAPSTYEADYVFPGDPPQPRLRPERVTSVEANVVRTQGALSAILSLYENQVRDLIDLVGVGSAGQTVFANRARALSRGLEGELDLVRGPGVRIGFSAACQRSEDQDTGAELSNSPRWNVQISGMRASEGDPLSIGLGLRYLSPRLTLARNRTAAAVVMDGRVARWLGPEFQIAFDVRNLLNTSYGDPGSREHVEDQIAQDSRRIFLSMTYHGGRH
jgi:iron complex outermembrane receptor protein